MSSVDCASSSFVYFIPYGIRFKLKRHTFEFRQLWLFEPYVYVIVASRSWYVLPTLTGNIGIKLSTV